MTMYIKSYSSGNGDNLDLLEANDIQVKECLLSFKELENEWLKNNKSNDVLSINYQDFFIGKIFEKTYKCLINNNVKTSFNLSNPKNKVEVNEGCRVLYIIKYLDNEGNLCYYIPCGTTYIVNDKGSTIQTINKRAGCN